jgi:hypothetical protein
VFNVARSIAACSGRKSISFYGDDVDTFLNTCEVVDGLVVVKCHSMDKKMLNLAKILGAKIIVSVRDPRDCAVSLFERFGFDIKTTLNDLSSSYASILSVPAGIDVLRLRYEDTSSFDAGAVRRIAAFVGCDLGDATAEKISSRFSHASVAENVSRSANSAETESWLDPSTQWHPDHVGDGLSGKWHDRLDPLNARVVESTILPMYQATVPDGMTLFWPAPAFSHVGSRDNPERILLDCEGVERCLVWGPYSYLPQGRWTAQFIIEPGNDDLALRLDILAPVPFPGLIGLKNIQTRHHQADELMIEFNHTDQSHALEARIGAMGDGFIGNFAFFGVKFTRSGPAPQRNPPGAKPILPWLP